MVERLVLARTHVSRNSLVPFLCVGEFGIDVEDHAAEWKQPVANHLPDREFGRFHHIHHLGSEAPVVAARKAPKALNLHITRPKIDPDFRLVPIWRRRGRSSIANCLMLAEATG